MRQFFDALNSYYWDSIQERNAIDDLTSPDAWVSSLIPLCNYAFERQGSPAVYRRSAIETFTKSRVWLENEERWSSSIERRLFDTFTKLCQENYIEKLNLKNNPMRPSVGNLISLINFAWHETNGKSITGWALSSIKKDNLRNSFKSLMKIRGVGCKISSFPLRDIYILSGCHNRNIQNRHLLHPIDIWTRRAARILSKDRKASDRECAKILIALEDEFDIMMGTSNIAFWVLGSQIAENEMTFIDFVQSIGDRDESRLNTLLINKISDQREWLNFLESLPINL